MKLVLGSTPSLAQRVGSGKVTAETLREALFFLSEPAREVYGHGVRSGGGFQGLDAIIEGMADADDGGESIRELTGGADAFRRACIQAEIDGRLLWTAPGLEWHLLLLLLHRHGREVQHAPPSEKYSIDAVRSWFEEIGLDIEIVG